MSRGSLGYASLSGSSQSARLSRLQTARVCPRPHVLVPIWRLPCGGIPLFRYARPREDKTHARGFCVIAPAYRCAWRLPVSTYSLRRGFSRGATRPSRIRYVNLHKRGATTAQSATADRFPLTPSAPRFQSGLILPERRSLQWANFCLRQETY